MGFSAEIHDFLNSAMGTYKLLNQGEETSAKTKLYGTQEEAARQEMNDPLNQQIKQSKLDLAKARIGAIGTGLSLKRQELQQQKDALQQQRDYLLGQAQGPANTYQRPAGAVGTGSTTAPLEPATAAAPSPYEFASGGIVPTHGGLGGMASKRYQDGGAVDDDDDVATEPDADTDDVTSGVTAPSAPTMPPAIGGAPAGAPTDISAQSRTRPGTVPIPLSKPQALQAIQAAQKYGVSLMAPPMGIPTSSRRRGLQAYASGAGAAPQTDMLALYQKIDPDGTMPESERNMTAIGAIYDYKMRNGDPQGAARAAFQMLQSYRVAARNFAAIGAAALQGGHIDAGLQALMKSYANIPDGNDLKLWQAKDGMIGYSVVDAKTGEKKYGGIAPPDKIAGQAMNMAAGPGFDEALMEQAAGGMPGSRGGAVGGRGKAAKEPDTSPVGMGSEKGNITPAASGELQKDNEIAINNFVTQQNQRNDKTHLFGLVGSKKEITDDEKDKLTNMLYSLRRNNDMPASSGIKMIQDYIGAPSNEKEGKPTFKYSADDKTKTSTIQFADGREFTMPTRDYAQFKTVRSEAIKQREDAAKKAEEDAKKPSSHVGAAISDWMHGELASPAEVKSRLQTQPPTAMGPEQPGRQALPTGRLGVVGAADEAQAAQRAAAPYPPSPVEATTPFINRPEFAQRGPAIQAPSYSLPRAANYNPRMGGGRPAVGPAVATSPPDQEDPYRYGVS